jgi:pentatricopeptide repeat protein
VAEGASGPWGAPATGASQDGDAGEGDALHTNTLAELYLRQGLVDKAVEVYRSMLRVDPDNQRAARRLADLAPGGAPSSAPARPHIAPVTVRPAPAADDRESPAAPILQATGAVEQGTGPEARAVGPVPPKRDERIDRLERWLDRMRAGGVREASPR